MWQLDVLYDIDYTRWMNCAKCKKECKNRAGLTIHEKYCDGTGTKKDKIKASKFVCHKCNQIIKTTRVRHVNSCNGFGTRRSQARLLGKGWSKGKTYLEMYGEKRSKEVIEKIRQRNAGKNPLKNFSDAEKAIFAEKSRKNINKRYENGWEPIAGRCKKIKYVSNVAGEVSLDGTWELLVAKYLDLLNVKWERNRLRFEYIHLNGKASHYTPDFYVQDWDSFIEVKGYETDLDRCKWVVG